MFQFTRQLTWRDLWHERLKLENCIISPQEGVMDYSCCAILCSIFVRDNPSPHSSKRLVKEKTHEKSNTQSLENTTLSRDETNGDQTTRHLPQHENGLSCWHIKLIAHSFFHFDSRAISTAKGSFLSIGMILWYTRNNCLFLVMDSLEQSGHGTRSIWCVANGKTCYSVLFFSANGDDYGICVTIVHNWMHFGECIVKPIT